MTNIKNNKTVVKLQEKFRTKDNERAFTYFSKLFVPTLIVTMLAGITGMVDAMYVGTIDGGTEMFSLSIFNNLIRVAIGSMFGAAMAMFLSKELAKKKTDSNAQPLMNSYLGITILFSLVGSLLSAALAAPMIIVAAGFAMPTMETFLGALYYGLLNSVALFGMAVAVGTGPVLRTDKRASFSVVMLVMLVSMRVLTGELLTLREAIPGMISAGISNVITTWSVAIIMLIFMRTKFANTRVTKFVPPIAFGKKRVTKMKEEFSHIKDYKPSSKVFAFNPYIRMSYKTGMPTFWVQLVPMLITFSFTIGITWLTQASIPEELMNLSTSSLEGQAALSKAITDAGLTITPEHLTKLTSDYSTVGQFYIAGYRSLFGGINAAYGIFLYIPLSIMFAIQPTISRYTELKDKENIKEAIKTALGYTLAISSLIFILILAMPGTWLSMFISNEGSMLHVQAASHGTKNAELLFILFNLGFIASSFVVSGQAIFQSLGKTRRSTLLLASRGIFLPIIVATLGIIGITTMPTASFENLFSLMIWVFLALSIMDLILVTITGIQTQQLWSDLKHKRGRYKF